MKKTFTTILIAIAAISAKGQDISEGTWTVTFDQAKNTMTIVNDGSTVISNGYAEAVCAVSTAADMDTIRSTEAQQTEFGTESVSDCFGSGRKYTYTYTFASGMRMIQSLSFYDGVEYLIASLGVTSTDGQQVKSNRLLPLASTTTNTALLPNSRDNRMIFVPWDNDSFIKYESKYLRSDMYSYSVTAVFNATSRFGLVTGAVDHDTWKSAIHVNPANYYKIDEIELISGYTDEHTHDTIASSNSVVAHGTVLADTVRSSRFMLGCFADWRDGLETFGKACTKVAPRREWDGGTPYGWNSWGVMQTLVSYEGAVDVGNFIRDNLMPYGFHDKQGRVVLSLDSWWNENFTSKQIEQFVSYCKSNNMIPGLYYGQFCLFADINGTVPGTSGRYKFSDIALKQNGQYKVIDGAYCLDPTHKGTKLYMLYNANKFKKWGIEYLKCDFMSNGAIEADSWADSDCHTGIQAYNEGMAYLLKQLGDDIYVDLSIAPLFPYQYAHGRRISCDAWGSIDNTKYVMANTSYGWWLNQVYFANDPDHLVMKTRDGSGSESVGVNRARLTSGAITGAYLSGDNFSDSVSAGYPSKSRERALELLTNEDVNEIPRTCASFRPVDGSNSSSLGAEEFMTYENDQYVYVAGINYKTLLSLSGTMKYESIGVDAENVSGIKELWTGTSIDAGADGFDYTIPATDARIYRIAKKSYINGISDTQASQESIRISVNGGSVRAECGTSDIVRIDIFAASGTVAATSSCHSRSASISTSGLAKGVYIVKATAGSGTSRTVKISK